MSSRKEKEALSKPVAFRLPASAYSEFKQKVEASGLSASEFFRQAILKNKTNIVARQTLTEDYRALTRYYRATSNNMNQIAYRANLDNLHRRLNDKAYVQILEELRAIERQLAEALR